MVSIRDKRKQVTTCCSPALSTLHLVTCTQYPGPSDTQQPHRMPTSPPHSVTYIMEADERYDTFFAACHTAAPAEGSLWAHSTRPAGFFDGPLQSSVHILHACTRVGVDPF